MTAGWPRGLRIIGVLSAAAGTILLVLALIGAHPSDPTGLRSDGPDHRCSDVTYVVGDSRRFYEHTVLPRTTDRIWSEELGTPGGERIDHMRHVRYLAEPGAVHERFTTDLAGLMRECVPGEHPLIFDFMGTNYLFQHPAGADDLATSEELRRTIARFYDEAAPHARVVLAELTFDRSTADSVARDGLDHYVARYNAALRSLASTTPTRFFFLPAPPIYDGGITWSNPSHEGAGTAWKASFDATTAARVDAAGVALTSRAGSVCALLDDPRFGVANYSEGATLIAYLQAFRRSSGAVRWLASGTSTLAGRTLSDPAPRCRF